MYKIIFYKNEKEISELENYINHPQEDFYTFCQTNMKIWKLN